MSQWKTTDMAAAWLNAAHERNRMLAAATERMFTLAGIREGTRVLDAGAGTGDTSLMLAHRLGPTGEVVAADMAFAMVSAAETAARDAGLDNVRPVVMDLNRALPALGSFDAVVSRKVLMFLEDVSGTLARLRPLLRPGGKLAAVVWAELDRNPFNAIPVASARARAELPSPPPEIVRAFSLQDPVHLESLMTRAGFQGVTVERVPALREFSSVADAMSVIRDTPLYRELFAHLGERERQAALSDVERAYAGFLRADGTVAFPIESLVTVGTAP
jgi:SAM-dependent methyltransferase